MKQFSIVPLSVEEANHLVTTWHRHHGPVLSHKFSLGLVLRGTSEFVGAATCGRPVARGRDDGWTLEVARLVTDGTPNACSALYGACWRAARALGYLRLGTYILDDETGVSLRAAGWRLVHQVRGRSWDTPTRPRVDTHPTQGKLLFEQAEPGFFTSSAVAANMPLLVREGAE